jgi:hypothetical protein
MRRSFLALVAVLALGCARTGALEPIPELEAYPLPAGAQASLLELAGVCDVLILGETHGTREVPAIVETLADGLTKAGFGAIALEIPHDEQPAIEVWATGKADVVPKFFAEPGSDGRGNREVLAMLRKLLAPPRGWALVCFDETETDLMRQVRDRLPKDANGELANLAGKLSPADMVAIGNQRDAEMAQLLAEGHAKLKPNVKVLVICGDLHARTANHASTDEPTAELWPSFAADFMALEPKSRVKSVNVQAFDGDYFNGGKVQQFSKRPLAQVEMQRTPDADWDAELNLPTATAATFLKPPRN